MAAKSDKRIPVPTWQVWRWLWVIWAIAASVALLSSSVLLLQSVRLPDERVYSGVLRPARNSLDIYLPEDLPFQSLNVAVGDIVTSGQTLAEYDQDSIAHELADLNRDLLVNNSLRACLISRAHLSDEQIVDMALDGETRLQLQSAMRECDIAQRAGTVEKRRLLAGLDHLNEQLRFVNHSTMQGFSKIQGQESLAFRLAVKASDLRTQITKLEIEMSALTMDQAEQMLVSSQRLEEEAKDLRARRAILQKYADKPRLVAPSSGRVTHVRSLEPGARFERATELLRLQDVQGDAFEAQIDVPRYVGDRLNTGEDVSILLRQAGDRAQSFAWEVMKVTKISAGLDGSGTSRVLVRANLPDKERVEDALLGLAVAPIGTELQVEVRLGETTPAEALLVALKEIVPQNARKLWTAQLSQSQMPW